MTPTGPQEFSDPAMLQLFCAEVERHSAGIEDFLRQVQAGAAAADCFAGMGRALRAMGSAARIVHLQSAVDLSSAMEQFIERAAKNQDTECLTATGVFADALTLMQRIGRLATPGTIEQFDALTDEIRNAVDALAAPPSSPKRQPATAVPAIPPEPVVTGDPMMLDLFMTELETHTQILSEGLVRFEQGNEPTTEIDALMRAAHSIKGAARIVKFDLAERLAHALEDRLLACRDGNSHPGPGTIDTMLKASDLLMALGNQACNRAGTDIDRLTTEVEQVIDALDGSTVGRGAVSAPVATAEADDRIPTADAGMLELFRSENQSHLETITGELVALERDPTRTEGFDSLMRAAHSIKGAARVVGLQAVVNLAHAMEEVFLAVRDRGGGLEAEQVDCLLQVSDTLRRAGKLAQPETLAQLAALTPEIEGFLPCLKAIETQRPLPARTPQAVASTGSGSVPTATVEAPAAGTPARQPVRVSTDQLEKLLALSGEAVVQSHWLAGQIARVQDLRCRHGQVQSLTSNLAALLQRNAATESGAAITTLRQVLKQCQESLTETVRELETAAIRIESITGQLHQAVIDCRLRPFGEGVTAFFRMVRDIARKLGKNARLTIAGAETKVDRDILEELKAPLTHLLRNALDHGLETPVERQAAGKPEEGCLTLTAAHRHGLLRITVSDDGRGIDVERLRDEIVSRGYHDEATAARLTTDEVLAFLFLPGFSTAGRVSDLSGRGVGMDVVHQMVQDVQGRAAIETIPGRGTTVTLDLPISRSLVRAIRVRINGELYAFRLTAVDHCRRLPRAAIVAGEGGRVIRVDGTDLPVIDAASLFGLAPAASGEDVAVVVLRDSLGPAGLIVDELLDECSLVIRPLDPRLGAVRAVAAAAIEEAGEPLLILDAEELMQDLRAALSPSSPAPAVPAAAGRVLVIDDSVTVRETERRLLEKHGFHVDLAIDGMDGWNALSTASYDAVVTDIDMPRLDGLSLLTMIRADERFARLPVVIVSYKDREQDVRAGLERGADAYLSKSSLHDNSLVQVLDQFLAGKGQ